MLSAEGTLCYRGMNSTDSCAGTNPRRKQKVKCLVLSSLLCLWCLLGAFAQIQHEVQWLPEGAQEPLSPLHEFVGATEPTATTRAIARWAGWEDGERLVCTSTDGTLRAVMLRTGRTWTLALWNDGEQKAKVTIQGSLPSGVYTTVRLVVSSNAEIGAIERRNGLRPDSKGRVSRVEWIEARSGLFLRFVERTRAVDDALNASRRSIWQSRVSRGVRSRLATLLRETHNHWYQVRASLRKNDLRMAARGVHRMLFLASGTRAVASGYTGLEEVSRQAEDLIDALSELSSALLNIVVSTRYTEQKVEVQVINAGAQVWKAVRFAPSTASEEAVVLANVKPMERAEASFMRTGEKPVSLLTVSVLFNGGTARLKMACILTEAEDDTEEQQ